MVEREVQLTQHQPLSLHCGRCPALQAVAAHIQSRQRRQGVHRRREFTQSVATQLQCGEARALRQCRRQRGQAVVRQAEVRQRTAQRLPAVRIRGQAAQVVGRQSQVCECVEAPEQRRR